MVYEDAEKLYAQIKKDGSELIEEAFKAILGFSSSDARSQPISGNFIGFNTTPFPRRDVVKVPFAGPHAAKLRSKLVQTTKDSKEGYALMDCATGGRLSSSCGMFADCHPVSGMHGLLSLIVCSLKSDRQSIRTDRIISC
jgi:alpha-mannosidase